MDDIQNVIALITCGLGLFGYLFPRKVIKIVGLSIENWSGYIEIKATYGGGFFAMGLAAMILNDVTAYKMLGALYLGLGLSRILTIVLAKKQLEVNNTFAFLLFEVVAGALLIF